MGKKKNDKVDVTGESFVSSPEQVTAACAADDANTAEETEEVGPAPDDGVFADEVAPADEVKAQELQPYVTRDPDFIGPTFVRNMPVPVPAEELAEHAKEQARLYGVREKAISDKKASAAGFTRLIKDTEHRLLEVSKVVELGTEERPTVCRWEFDYPAGIKKLRRLDNFQIYSEETLTAEECQPSLFNQQAQESEAAVEQLRAVQGEAVETTPLTDDPAPTIELYRPSNGTEGESFTAIWCSHCAEDDPDNEIYCDILTRTAALGIDDPGYPQEWCYNGEGRPVCTAFDGKVVDANFVTEEPKPGLTLPGPHACKVCSFDTDSHIYPVRHLRDVHAMKLSEYKAQFPTQQ